MTRREGVHSSGRKFLTSLTNVEGRHPLITLSSKNVSVAPIPAPMAVLIPDGAIASISKPAPKTSQTLYFLLEGGPPSPAEKPQRSIPQSSHRQGAALLTMI